MMNSIDRISHGDPVDGGQLIPRATIADIASHWNRALELYGEAYEAVTQASTALQVATWERHKAAPGKTRYNYQVDTQSEDKAFFSVLQVPEHDDFMAGARKRTLAGIHSQPACLGSTLHLCKAEFVAPPLQLRLVY